MYRNPAKANGLAINQYFLKKNKSGTPAQTLNSTIVKRKINYIKPSQLSTTYGYTNPESTTNSIQH